MIYGHDDDVKRLVLLTQKTVLGTKLVMLREPKIYGLIISLLRRTVPSWLAQIQPPIPSPSQLCSHCL